MCQWEQRKEEFGVGGWGEVGGALGFGKRLVPGPFVRGNSNREGLVLELKVTEAPFQDVCNVVRRGGLKVGFEFLE